MRLGLFGIKMVILFSSIAVASLLVLTFVPLAMGGLDVQVPDGEELSWSFEDEVIQGDIPIQLKNGGYFAIEDLVIWMNFSDGDDVVFSSASEPTDLTPEQWVTIDIPIHFDLSTVDDELAEQIVFYGIDLQMELGLDSYWGLHTIEVSIAGGGDSQFHLPAMIENLDLDMDNMRVEMTEFGPQLVLPYSFGASELLYGRLLQMDVTMSNDTAELSQAMVSMGLQQQNQGELRFTLTNEEAERLMSGPDHLIADVQIDFEGLEYQTVLSYDWNPSLGADMVGGA